MFETTPVIAFNLIAYLGGKETLSKDEILLYNQACSMLQNYLRLTEINLKNTIEQMEA